MKLDRREAGAEQNWNGEERPVRNVQVQKELDSGGWSDAPHHDDRILILRVRLQLRTPSTAEVLEMQVRRMEIVIVIQVRGVNVQERRLRKTPQEHRDTEAGARSSHCLHTLSAARRIVKGTKLG